MLETMDWHVSPPTKNCFYHQFLGLLPSNVSPITLDCIREITRLVFEIAICEYSFTKYFPSTIAFAGIMLAMDCIDESELPVWQRHCFLIRMVTIANMDSKAAALHQAIEEFRPYMCENRKLRDFIHTRIHFLCDDDNKMYFDQAMEVSPRQSYI
jgi:hypothetical protein